MNRRGGANGRPASRLYFTPQHAPQSVPHAGQAWQSASQPSQPNGHAVADCADGAQQWAASWQHEVAWLAPPQHVLQSTAQPGQLPHPSTQFAHGTEQQLLDTMGDLFVPAEVLDSQPIRPTNDTITIDSDFIAAMTELRFLEWDELLSP